MMKQVIFQQDQPWKWGLLTLYSNRLMIINLIINKHSRQFIKISLGYQMDNRFPKLEENDYDRAQFYYNYNFGGYPPFPYFNPHMYPPLMDNPYPYPQDQAPVKIEYETEKQVKKEEVPIDENDEDVRKIFQHIRTSCRYDITKELLKRFQKAHQFNFMTKIKLSHYRTYEYLLCYLKLIAQEPEQAKRNLLNFMRQQLDIVIHEKTQRQNQYRYSEKNVFSRLLRKSLERIIQVSQIFLLQENREQSFKILYKMDQTNNYVSRKNFQKRKLEDKKVIEKNQSNEKNISPIKQEKSEKQ